MPEKLSSNFGKGPVTQVFLMTKGYISEEQSQ